MDDETRGERIARLREARGWTRQQLATYAKVANNTIWRLEEDKTGNPQANVIESIAEALAFLASLAALGLHPSERLQHEVIQHVSPSGGAPPDL